MVAREVPSPLPRHGRRSKNEVLKFRTRTCRAGFDALARLTGLCQLWPERCPRGHAVAHP